MIKSIDIVNFLLSHFPGTTFYDGTIDKNNDKCIGIYTRGSVGPRIALGGVACTTYSVMPIQALFHWTESTERCQEKANDVYSFLFGKSNFHMGSKRIVGIQMLDSCPVGIGRDENNIAEMSFRFNILYDKEEKND